MGNGKKTINCIAAPKQRALYSARKISEMTIGEILFNLRLDKSSKIAHKVNIGQLVLEDHYITIDALTGSVGCCAWHCTRYSTTCSYADYIPGSSQENRNIRDVLSIIQIVDGMNSDFGKFAIGDDLKASIDSKDTSYVSGLIEFNRYYAACLSGYVFVPDSGDTVVYAELGRRMDDSAARMVGPGRWYSHIAWAKYKDWANYRDSPNLRF